MLEGVSNFYSDMVPVASTETMAIPPLPQTTDTADNSTPQAVECACKGCATTKLIQSWMEFMDTRLPTLAIVAILALQIAILVKLTRSR
jgi:hypothetical protein